MNYIGSKHSLSDFLLTSISSFTSNADDDYTGLKVCDGFAGTGAVSKLFKEHGATIIANDIQTYMELEEALYSTVGVTLTSKSVSEWLAEVEKAIEDEAIASGLIIFWDEFTSIMEAIGSDRINVLQNIAEKAQSCNLFLFRLLSRIFRSNLPDPLLCLIQNFRNL